MVTAALKVGLVAVGSITMWALFKAKAKTERRLTPAHNGNGVGLLQWQHRRQRRAAARATPQERLVADFSRALNNLASLVQCEADEMTEGVFQALRRLREDALHARLKQLTLQLEDVLMRLDMLHLGQADYTEGLRVRRRRLVSNIQTELDNLDEYLQGYAVARSAVSKLNAVLDALREREPDFVCPITHDIMRAPVIASSGKTYEAAALRAHGAAQQRRGVQPTCPLTVKVLHPAGERQDRELQFAINLAVKQAIAESGASEAEHAIMWGRWLRAAA